MRGRKEVVRCEQIYVLSDRSQHLTAQQKAEQEAARSGPHTHTSNNTETHTQTYTHREHVRASGQLGQVTTCKATLPTEHPAGQDKTLWTTIVPESVRPPRG